MTNNKKKLIVFSVIYISVVTFVLFELAVYENTFVGDAGEWYAKESMKPLEYLAYLLTYALSFPIGTLVAVFNSSFLSQQWLLVTIPNCVLLFFLIKKIREAR